MTLALDFSKDDIEDSFVKKDTMGDRMNKEIEKAMRDYNKPTEPLIQCNFTYTAGYVEPVCRPPHQRLLLQLIGRHDLAENIKGGWFD